jgi:hypothetical protein
MSTIAEYPLFSRLDRTFTMLDHAKLSNISHKFKRMEKSYEVCCKPQ